MNKTPKTRAPRTVPANTSRHLMAAAGFDPDLYAKHLKEGELALFAAAHKEAEARAEATAQKSALEAKLNAVTVYLATPNDVAEKLAAVVAKLTAARKALS